MADALDLLDERVRGFAACVAEPVGAVVGEDLGFPAADGLGEPVAFGDVSCLGDVVELDQRFARGGLVRGAVDGPELFFDDVRVPDFVVGVARVEPCLELLAAALGQAFFAGEQQPADAIQRVALVAAMPECLLLHPAADLIDHLVAEPDHVEGVHDDLRRGKATHEGVVVAAAGIERDAFDRPTASPRPAPRAKR